ncbi:MAG: hypothetical protein AAF297_11910 [Planctomycetota bacterium]
MGTKAVIWAVAVCAVAWLFAVVTWPSGVVEDGGDPLPAVSIAIDPASVVGVSVSFEDRRVEASRSGDVWDLRFGDRGRWRGDGASILSAVRSLASGTLRESPEPAVTGASFSVLTRDGQRVTLELSEDVAGGFVAARLNAGDGTRGVLAPAGLLEAARAAVNGGWRSALLVPRIEPGVSAIAIESGTSSVELKRVAGRWAFEGSRARVDAESVERLLGRLQGLRAGAWLASADGPAAASIELRTSRPTGEVWVQRLEIVGQADLAGELVAVRAVSVAPGETEATWRRVTAAVPAAAVRGLPANAGPFFSRTSIASAPADVVRLEVAGRVVQREGSGWRRSDGTLIARSEAAGIEQLLGLLAVDEGRVVVRPEGEGVAARVWPIGAVEGVELALFVDDDRVIVWDGTVARAYAGEVVWGFD